MYVINEKNVCKNGLDSLNECLKYLKYQGPLYLRRIDREEEE